MIYISNYDQADQEDKFGHIRIWMFTSIFNYTGLARVHCFEIVSSFFFKLTMRIIITIEFDFFMKVV